ncbi:MAG TPA: histidine phosphatase family protein [Beijerinckiaceae bacterium]|nr:histidine phosphatase family protein [Beijerinckiaceae bacterium]
MHWYLTHPQVRIDPAIPVPDWGLSDVGRARIMTLAGAPWIRRFGRIVSSGERKAMESAQAVGLAIGVPVELAEASHENDRSSTGFLPPQEFERMADAFFASPQDSVRGWERAIDAQARIVAVVRQVLQARPRTPTLFVGHGGVGTLLKCWLRGRDITRAEDQGPGGGGNHFGFTLSPKGVLHDWLPLETPPPG